MKKRTFSKLFVAGGGLLVGGIVGIPALVTTLSPSLRRPTEASWQPVGHLDQFPIGEVVKAVVPIPRDDWARALRERGVFVLRESEDEVIVYSRSCTDLSCPVAFDPGSEWFFCPCHGGVFAKDGTPRAGPPNEPLFRYANRVRDRVVEVDINSVPAAI